MCVNFAVIGTNFITDRFLEAAGTVDGFRLKAVCSRTVERAEAYAAKQGAERIFTDPEALARCGEIDAVYVASPNSLHASQSIRMMEHGKHVLCEKTIASNSRELSQMIAAAERNQVILLEAMRSIHSPGFAAIRESLPRLGTLRRVMFTFCKYSSRYDRFKRGIVENAFNPSLSNGALTDIGVYCVHPLVALFGAPENLVSTGTILPGSIDGQGTILADYGTMQAQLLYSKISDSSLPSEIQGEDGTMLIHRIQDPQAVCIRYRDGSEENLPIPQVQNNMCYELRAFLSLMEKGQVRHPYLEYSRMALELMDKVRFQQGIRFPADII